MQVCTIRSFAYFKNDNLEVTEPCPDIWPVRAAAAKDPIDWEIRPCFIAFGDAV